MVDIREIDKVKRQIEDMKSNLAKAQGALQETLRVLKEEYGVDTLEQAKKSLGEKLVALEKNELLLKKALEEFQAAYGDKLGGEK